MPQIWWYVNHVASSQVHFVQIIVESFCRLTMFAIPSPRNHPTEDQSALSRLHNYNFGLGGVKLCWAVVSQIRSCNYMIPIVVQLLPWELRLSDVAHHARPER